VTETIHAPHPGAQEAFLSSPVEELFIGGEKGNGKSWLLLHEFLYDVEEPDANAILFRRTYPDLEDLWNKAHLHYQGYKLKEIAGMMKCTEGTVKKYLFTATRRMRDQLKDVYQQGV